MSGMILSLVVCRAVNEVIAEEYRVYGSWQRQKLTTLVQMFTN